MPRYFRISLQKNQYQPFLSRRLSNTLHAIAQNKRIPFRIHQRIDRNACDVHNGRESRAVDSFQIVARHYAQIANLVKSELGELLLPQQCVPAGGSSLVHGRHGNVLPSLGVTLCKRSRRRRLRKHEEEYQCHSDAIHAEDGEVVLAHERQEETYRRERNDERYEEADGKHARLL